MDPLSTTVIDASAQSLTSVERGNFKIPFGYGKYFASFAKLSDSAGGFLAPNSPEYSSNAVNLKIESEDKSAGYLIGPAAQRRKIYEQAHDKFIDIALSEYFEYGYTPPSERYVAEFAQEYPGILGELIQGISLSQAGSPKVMVALLNAVGSLKYEDVRPFGQVLAVAAVSNLAVEVKEAAIRVYEAWGHPEGAMILAKVDCPWPWLDEYRKQVIADLGAGR